VLGGAASVTGVGAALGVPVMVVSTVAVAGGIGNIAAGIRGLASVMSGGGGTGAPATSGGSGPAINSQKQAGHVPGTPQYANRIKSGKLTSAFLSAKQGEAVIIEAWKNGTHLGANGTMRLHDFGRPIGLGPAGGGYQTQVRVSIDASGQIHGTPWGQIFEGPLPQ